MKYYIREKDVIVIREYEVCKDKIYEYKKCEIEEQGDLAVATITSKGCFFKRY